MNLSNFKPLLVFPVALLCTSCAPTIHVAVPKPVVIDVNMKVDVTTRSEGGTTTTTTTTNGTNSATATPAPTNTPEGAAADRNEISGEVQGLKDDRLIGENNQGFLEARQTPSGKLPSGEDYTAYVARIVKQENDDRRVLYTHRASKENVPFQTIQTEAAKRWHDSAYPGEWVQEVDGSWKQAPPK